MKALQPTVFILFSVCLIIIIGGAIALNKYADSGNPELMMGQLVVVSIVTMMTVLFIIAAGFNSMKLTDEKQALGLPEGSIRAMIALVLIMVFIIFSIYTFRRVGSPSKTYIGSVKDTKTVIVPEGKKTFAVLLEPIPLDQKRDSSNYYVYVVSELGEESNRLAQQLITTVATLVVAVSSFYFGSSTVAAAKKEIERSIADQSGGTPANPEIRELNPKEAKKGDTIDNLEIKGTGFKNPKAVKLCRDNEEMVAEVDLSKSNADSIKCKVKIDKAPGGKKWDVIVINEDDKQAKLDGAFEIKA